MLTASESSNNDGYMPQLNITSKTALIRLVIGLLQGIALYLLYSSARHAGWPATSPSLFSSLILVFVMVPILMISSLGHLSVKSLMLWLLSAIVILTGLAFYDHWRQIGSYQTGYGEKEYLSPLLCVFTVAGFFIGHALVQAAAQEQRYIASYPAYFDSAWKLLIQLAFSQIFVGAFWLVLWLGAGLFSLLGLKFFGKLISEAYFFIPVTAFTFAFAVHLTDVRPAIVRGIRSLLLVLLSWILPLAVLIIASFLLMLPVTGLAPLWATRHAAALLLVAAAVLVILINMAYQNGAVSDEVAAFLRFSARIACLLLLPLVAIAGYALALRVGDYGWTDDRIIAACCVLVAAFYAAGYAWATCQKGEWLVDVAPVNVVTAFVIIAVLLALFSPLLDPARISVASQVARLKTGKENPQKFDYNYLRFDSVRFGQEALLELENTQQGKDASIIRQQAQLALVRKNRWDKKVEKLNAVQLSDNFTTWPAGSQLPQTFLTNKWDAENPKIQNSLPNCLHKENSKCDAYQFDYNGDGVDEILLVPAAYGDSVIFQLDEQEKWQEIATLGYLVKCKQFNEKLQSGDIHSVPAVINDIIIGGKRFTPKPIRPYVSVCDNK